MGVPDLWAAITRFGNKTLLFTKLCNTAGPFALTLITINYLRLYAVNVKGIIWQKRFIGYILFSLFRSVENVNFILYAMHLKVLLILLLAPTISHIFGAK